MYFVLNEDYLGEYKTFFHPTKLGRNFYCMHVLQRLVIAFALAAGQGSFISGAVCIVYLVMISVVVIVARPYRDMKQNIRNIANNCCGMGIIGIYTYVSYVGSSEGNSFTVYLPYVVIGLVLAVTLMGMTFISLQLVETFKECFSKSKTLDSPATPNANI